MGSRLVSIVVPLRNEASGLERFLTELRRVTGSLQFAFEFVLIDDGSTDDTWNLIQKEASSDAAIRGFSLSRGFGKEGAIAAGISAAEGAAIIVMDGDLQHPPGLLGEMLNHWQGGASIVEAVRMRPKRGRRAGRLARHCIYRVMERLTGFEFDDMTDFKLLDREVVDVLQRFPERLRFFRGLVAWTGFPAARIMFEPPPRSMGKSQWDLSSLLHLTMDMITGFTHIPLRLVTLGSCLMVLFSAALTVQTLWMYVSGRSVEGFTTVIICILLVGGILGAGIGILGEYVARIYQEVKGRPAFIVHRRTRKTDG